MHKLILSVVAGVAIAGAALAQSEEREEAQELLRSAGVELEIPADATEDQLSQIIAMANDNEQGGEHLEFEVKKILGME